MGFLARILGRAPLERRDALAQMHGLMPAPMGGPGLPDLAGRSLSPIAAENLAAVMAAAGVIGSVLGICQPLAFRRDGTGRAELPPAHWLARLLRQPSERFTWPEWCESVVADCLLHGNALAEVRADGGGRVVALEPIGWRHVAVSILPSGRVAYDVTLPEAPRRGLRQVRRLLDSEVLHLRDRCDAGEVVARSRLARAAGAVRNVAALQTMSEAVWQNAMRIGGYVSAPMTFTREQRPLAEELLKRFTGAMQAGRVPILESGWKYEQLGIDAESAQTLESRRFGITEIARIFQIPPPLLQDYTHNTFTNSEQASRWFGQFTIAPWARKLEAAVQRCVIGAGSDLSVELDMSSLLRGSDLERWQAHKIGVETGVLDPDEVRQVEGWGPRATPRQVQQQGQAA